MNFKRQCVILIAIMGCHLNITTVQADLLQLGPCVGINTWHTKFQEGGATYYKSNNIGFQIGLVSRFHPLFIYVQPEISFVFDRYTVTQNNNVLNDTMWSKKFKMALPIGFSFLGLLRIHAGFAVNFPFSKAEENLFNIKTYYQKVQWALLIGGGLDIKKLMVDTSFEFSFLEAHKCVTGGSASYRPKYFVLKIGYNLL